MVTAGSPGDGSVNSDNNVRAGGKRKASDAGSPQDGPTHTRSKRSRYISIACNECKRRKIKCNGQTPCQRCGNLSLECVYSPNCCTNTLRDSQEFKQMQDQIAALQDQVADLYSTINDLRTQSQFTQQNDSIYLPLDRRPSTLAVQASRTLPPLLSPRAKEQQRPLPRFHGPTSSIYGFDVAKSSLSNMGITQQPDTDGFVSRDRSQAASPVQLAPHPSKDPMWLLDQQEAIRLLRVYDEEIHIMYPVLDMEKLISHIKNIYSFIGAALRSGFAQPGLAGEDALDDEMTTQLKLVLGCALILEGHGQHELGQKLYDSAKKSVDLVIVGPLSLKAVVLIILTATFHFQKDEETQAWRFIGIAGRQCIEMGLHRRDSLMRSFPNNQSEFAHAVRVFWVVYALDRRWSFGTGMPFSLQDSDIDPLLPEPDNTYPYLKHITTYNHIATKIWQHIAAFDSGNSVVRRDDIGYLDFQIMQWYNALPSQLKFDSSNLTAENEVPDRKTRRLRFLMFLRKNQARISVYRPILHSATSIAENRTHAETVIAIAKDTISTIIGIDRISDIYRTQQVCYNYFLVQALAVIFLSVAHAPAVFCDPTRQEFYGAIDLIKGFSTKSHTTRRLWRTVRGLKELGHKIGQLAAGQQPTPQHDDAHSDAALAMAGLAGHKVDNYPPPPTMRHQTSVDMSYSPEDASQMGNELTALFEMAGAYGQPNTSGNISAPGMEAYTPFGVNGEDGEMGFNAMFGNEPEFSRIMNELL
ncbi:hypothetical protein PMZ80_009827 [Knufia obscura]|uniref:Zn(2)-C6 fungal-type domain-containing protein n=2 Tax=Knufia TaxID=430999 RepID=A0AAN8EU58_9EURO|nr:hypothetical protein PMZ80_009827 [Knufia obscura]KAK5955920.1 hypothetical protein OHC33_002493 [Knufia fluminis]